MNKFLKLILSFLFFIGLIKVNDVFCAAKITENSSSSSSSSVSATASAIVDLGFQVLPSDSELEDELGEWRETSDYADVWKDVPLATSVPTSQSSTTPLPSSSHGEIMRLALSRQKKVTQEISKLKEFKYFPPGLIPLILQYEDYNDDATQDLIKILKDRRSYKEQRLQRLNDEQTLINIHQALKNGANPNNPIDPNDFTNSPLCFELSKPKPNYKIVKTLIDAGANVNSYEERIGGGVRIISSPISWAILKLNKSRYEESKENIEIFRLLLEKKANPNVEVSTGITLFFRVAGDMENYYKANEIIKLLLHNGVVTPIDIINKEPEVKKAYEEYLQEKAEQEMVLKNSLSSSSKIQKARVAEPFNYPGSPALAPKDDKVALTIHQLRFLWENVTPEQRKAWEDAGGPDVDPRTIKEIGRATVRIILG